jgi:hypothetical protein
MIGATFSDPSDATMWRVVAADGGAWVVSCESEFRPVERLTTADLAARFNVAEPHAPTQPSEADGWRALEVVNRRAALKLATGDVPDAPSPEDHFIRVSDADARRLGHRDR